MLAASSAPDAGTATDIVHEIQRIDCNQGGYIIFSFSAVIGGLLPERQRHRGIQHPGIGQQVGPRGMS